MMFLTRKHLRAQTAITTRWMSYLTQTNVDRRFLQSHSGFALLHKPCEELLYVVSELEEKVGKCE